LIENINELMFCRINTILMRRVYMITEQPGFKYEAPFRSSFLSPWEALLLLGTTRLLYSKPTF
jgi:hypothetical protein